MQNRGIQEMKPADYVKIKSGERAESWSES
jgi:hypothetical protein